MKILVVGSYRYDIYAKAFFEAFRRLGHDTASLDTDAFDASGGPLQSFMEKVKHHYLVGPAIARAGKALKQAVKDFNPDLVFLYHCYFFHPSVVKKISEKTLVFSYDCDDAFEKRSFKHNSDYYKAAARYCQQNYVYRNKNVKDFAGIGVNNVKVLLPYYTQTRNFPTGRPKDIPLAFVGHWEDDGRDEAVKALLDAGLPFSLYGHVSTWSQSKYWPQLKTVYYGPADGDLYNEVLNRTQVALVFFSRANNDTYTRRCFELPVTKTVMLSEYTADMDRFWPEDDCCVYFRDNKELVQKAAWLLDHPQEMLRIAGNAYEHLKALGCSETDRVREILADYERIVRGNNPL